MRARACVAYLGHTTDANDGTSFARAFQADSGHHGISASVFISLSLPSLSAYLFYFDSNSVALTVPMSLCLCICLAASVLSLSLCFCLCASVFLSHCLCFCLCLSDTHNLSRSVRFCHSAGKDAAFMQYPRCIKPPRSVTESDRGMQTERNKHRDKKRGSLQPALWPPSLSEFDDHNPCTTGPQGQRTAFGWMG